VPGTISDSPNPSTLSLGMTNPFLGFDCYAAAIFTSGCFYSSGLIKSERPSPSTLSLGIAKPKFFFCCSGGGAMFSKSSELVSDSINLCSSFG
jgi:hypothetical protein